MKRPILLAAFAILTTLASSRGGDDGKCEPGILHRPLSKVEALNIAIAHNGTILQAQKDVEAAAGVAVQIRAILYPQVSGSSYYVARQDSLIETNQNRKIPENEIVLPGIGTVPVGGGELPKINNQAWFGEIRIAQSLYQGGRMLSAIRSSRLLREQSLLQFESTVADTLLAVMNAYDDVLSTAMQVEVRTASVKLLTEYLRITRIKASLGDVPEFDVLRQEVEVANAQAALVQAIGAHRVAKQVFVELLGYDLPTTVSDDLPLNLTTPLVACPYPNELSAALAEALVNRSEIAALEKEELLRNEAIIVARAGYKPSVQAFAGYQLTSRLQTREVDDALHGGIVGAQVSWPIFDGFLTKGRVDEAVALRGKAGEAKAETTRIVELQVRTAWSELRTARSVLDALAKNLNKAAKALSLVQERYDVGSAAQVEVLSAQTALTDARTTYVQGLRDYSVARSRMLRATGAILQPEVRQNAGARSSNGKTTQACSRPHLP